MLRLYYCRVNSAKEHSSKGRELLKYVLKRDFSINTEPIILLQKKGKPYFENIKLYFNISHSGKYVACAISDEEVGVDIQKKKSIRKEVCERFIGNCKPEDACLEWSKREAYGKFTGDGALGNYLERTCFIKQYFIHEDYFCLVCTEHDIPLNEAEFVDI